MNPLDRKKLYTIIFKADTPAGKSFDLALLWAIILSVGLAMLESVPSIPEDYAVILRVVEIVFTIIFTIEYMARLYCVDHPLKYAVSFLGIIDLFSLIPTYFSFIFPGVHVLLVIRTIRLLRIFRILKLSRYIGEADTIIQALKRSKAKITVFIGAVIVIVIIMGTIMYVLEGPEHGFSSIPQSIYWAIVTLTTVGYGDIAPKTIIGQAISSFVMIMGYGIIAVPTGIVTAEFTRTAKDKDLKCTSCGKKNHDNDAFFCKYCGEQLKK